MLKEYINLIIIGHKDCIYSKFLMYSISADE